MVSTLDYLIWGEPNPEARQEEEGLPTAPCFLERIARHCSPKWPKVAKEFQGGGRGQCGYPFLAATSRITSSFDDKTSTLHPSTLREPCLSLSLDLSLAISLLSLSLSLALLV
jgi:hypothetical protein